MLNSNLVVMLTVMLILYVQINLKGHCLLFTTQKREAPSNLCQFFNSIQLNFIFISLIKLRISNRYLLICFKEHKPKTYFSRCTVFQRRGESQPTLFTWHQSGRITNAFSYIKKRQVYTYLPFIQCFYFLCGDIITPQ